MVIWSHNRNIMLEECNREKLLTSWELERRDMGLGLKGRGQGPGPRYSPPDHAPMTNGSCDNLLGVFQFSQVGSQD